MSKKIKVLMIGPGRTVKGGISTVVNLYYKSKLPNEVELKYIGTMQDGSKIKKLVVAVLAYCKFIVVVKRYDVVHIHMAAYASFIRKSFFVNLANRYKKKIIIHQHAGDFDSYYKALSGKMKKRVLDVFGKADGIIVLSNTMKEFFETEICEKEKVRLLCNGVMIPENIDKNYEENNVLFMGRLEKDKGIYDLLEAAKKVVQCVPDVKFHIVGDGDLNRCKDIVKQYDLQENVFFIGWINNEHKEIYLKDCSMFVLPSYYEGMPMALLEAMSYGHAVISTNVGGIPQIINNNENGLIINPGDVDALSSYIIDLLLNPKKKLELGNEGREYIRKHFSIVDYADRLLEFYDFLCAR